MRCEKYILVTDDEYCYTLDTESEDYKTLEDFEKQEFKNAKKDNVDIKEYEEDILQEASDKYWDWVYNSHLEATDCNDIMNVLHEENQRLKQKLELQKRCCANSHNAHQFLNCYEKAINDLENEYEDNNVAMEVLDKLDKYYDKYERGVDLK